MTRTIVVLMANSLSLSLPSVGFDPRTYRRIITSAWPFVVQISRRIVDSKLLSRMMRLAEENAALSMHLFLTVCVNNSHWKIQRSTRSSQPFRLPSKLINLTYAWSYLSNFRNSRMLLVRFGFGLWGIVCVDLNGWCPLIISRRSTHSNSHYESNRNLNCMSWSRIPCGCLDEHADLNSWSWFHKLWLKNCVPDTITMHSQRLASSEMPCVPAVQFGLRLYFSPPS